MKLSKKLFILAAAIIFSIYFLLQSKTSNSSHIEKFSSSAALLEPPSKREINNVGTGKSDVVLTTCGIEMNELIDRLQRDINVNSSGIYHLIQHAATSQVIKENYLESLGGNLSVHGFRASMPRLSVDNVSSFKKMMDAIHIIKITRLLTANDYNELDSYLNSNPAILNQTINSRSILSFAIANVEKESGASDILRLLTSQGFTPSMLDLLTAIDAKKSTKFIDEIIRFMKLDLGGEFNIDNVLYNLATYSASKERYDYALHFYRVHGVGLAVNESYSVLDFINYETIDPSEQLKELILLAAQLDVYPARIVKVPAYLAYIKLHLPPDMLERLDRHAVFKTDDEFLREALDPERQAKLQELIRKGKSLNQQLDMLKPESRKCHQPELLESAGSGHKSAIAASDPSTKDEDGFFFDGSLSQAEMLYKAALLVSDGEIADSIVVDKSFRLIIEGEPEEGLSSLDNYLQARSADEKSKVYSSLLARCVREMKSAGAIQQLMERGAKMNEKAIFMFIINNNVQAVEVYKKYHDIRAARSVQGIAPLEYAIKMKADADLIARLQ